MLSMSLARMGMLAAAGAAAPAVQEFPALRGTVAVSSQASGSTFSPAIPAHQAGDLILIFLSLEWNGSGQGWPSGWNSAGGGFNGTTFQISGYKYAAGSGTTLTYVNNTGGQITAHVYVIKGTTSAPHQLGFSQSGDPPSGSPSWGLAKNLWFFSVASNSTTGSVPSGYTGTATSTRPLARLVTGWRQREAATENPGNTAATGDPAAGTYAVGPN